MSNAPVDTKLGGLQALDRFEWGAFSVGLLLMIGEMVNAWTVRGGMRYAVMFIMLGASLMIWDRPLLDLRRTRLKRESERAERISGRAEAGRKQGKST